MLLPFLASLLSLGMLACASGPSTPTTITLPAPPTTLDGNWSLAGTRTPATYPLLSTFLTVQGSQVFGGGYVQIQCSPVSGISGNFNLAGQIAADGTFTATYSTPPSPTLALGGYTVTLSGSSPTAASPGSWTGSYTLTASLPNLASPPLTPCTYTHSASFTATPITALTGTYSGPAVNFLASSGPTLGANVALTFQVAQQPATLVTTGTAPNYQLPLVATLGVTGSTCFTSGSSEPLPVSSQITGDSFNLSFLMNDGSQLLLSGNLTDPSAASLAISVHVIGGSCPNVFGVATLVRH